MAWSGARGVDAAGVVRGEMDGIFSMTSGVLMHAMPRNVPPHTPRVRTRLSRCIQIMGAERVAWSSWTV